MPTVNWLALTPVLALILGALLIVSLDLFAGRTRPWVYAGQLGISFGAIGVSGGSLVWVGPQQGMCVADACSYALTAPRIPLQLVLLIAAAGCLLLTAAEHPGSTGPGSGQQPERLILTLLATSGAVLLPAVWDYAGLLVAVELAALPVVGLVALGSGARGAEAALKLLVMTLGSFAIATLGVALIYASTGTLALGGHPLSSSFSSLHWLGLLLLAAGFAAKLALVPAHWWAPETYAGAPIPVVAFLATVSKGAGLAALLAVLGSVAAQWYLPIGILAALTMTIGNLGALRQRSAIRLVAWSAVAQVGWVLLPMAGAGSGNFGKAEAAAIGYLLAYILGSLAVLTVVAAVGGQHPGRGEHPITAYAGLYRTQPVAAAVLVFGLLCLAGLPPGVMGLVAKLAALAPVVGVGSWWVVSVVVVNIVLGVAVYLRWIAAIFRPAPCLITPIGTAHRAGMALAMGACLALSLLPEGLLALARIF